MIPPDFLPTKTIVLILTAIFATLLGIFALFYYSVAAIDDKQTKFNEENPQIMQQQCPNRG